MRSSLFVSVHAGSVFQRRITDHFDHFQIGRGDYGDAVLRCRRHIE